MRDKADTFFLARHAKAESIINKIWERLPEDIIYPNVSVAQTQALKDRMV